VNLRRLRRAVALGWALAQCLFLLILACLSGSFTLQRRALWLQSAARLVIARLGIRCRIYGEPPARGLIASNHLGYLDILVYAATLPCCFVAKAEIANWPLFGLLARASGAIFLHRSSLSSARMAATQMIGRLQGPVPVLFFPEGTSTDGSHLLRFHPRLFHSAMFAAAPVTAAAIRYGLADGTPERELCWYGDASFLPHLWKTLGRDALTAEVCFGEPQIYNDCRLAAHATNAAVAAMRSDPSLLS
jgi:lyso-ornithine lipid O-acyltransferase